MHTSIRESNVDASSSKRQVTVFLMGAQPWNRDRVFAEAASMGLDVVALRTVDDSSAIYLGSSHAPDGADAIHSEVLPSDYEQITDNTLEALLDSYGDNIVVFGLNDYTTEYAAALSNRLGTGCYPVWAADIVKRKHKLRTLWNGLAEDSRSQLAIVEFCYAEKLDGQSSFTLSPSKGFDALGEELPFFTKPDELSASIEVARVIGKTDALKFAQLVCGRLEERWRPVGKVIGAEVRPRVIVEQYINRSSALHPGAEFSMEFLSFEGHHHAVGVTQKWTGLNYVETGHMFPATSLPAGLYNPISKAIQSLLNQLNVRYAISHWEFIVTADEKVALVEGHLRPAGGRILDLIEISTGHSPTKQLFEAFLAQEDRFDFQPKCQAGLFWMVPKTPLTSVSSIEYGELASALPQGRLFINEPELRSKRSWSGASDWMTRLAHVVGTGEDPDSLLAYCRSIAGDILLRGLRDDKEAETSLMLAIDQPAP